MKKKRLIYFIITVFFVTGCSSEKQSKISLPCIDVTKNYPVKELILTDIATVSYVHLNTEKDEYLYKGIINYVTENTIVVADESSGSILFFSKDGEPKSHFNRFGEGPEDYGFKGRSLKVIYDEAVDDVFLRIIGGFNVYSSTGEYKRKIVLPQGTIVSSLVDYDDQSFFLFDFQNDFNRSSKDGKDLVFPSNDSSYFRISKIDGKVMEYVIFQSIEIDLTNYITTSNGGWMTQKRPHGKIQKCPLGLYIFRIDADTIFLCGKDKSITPIFCKTPLASKLESKVLLTDFIETDRYQFLQVSPFVWENLPSRKLYFRDKQSGNIYKQKISLPDYKEKEFSIFDTNMQNHANVNQVAFLLDLFELKEAYKANKLSGKLKELVAKLDENNDNDVYMFVTFK